MSAAIRMAAVAAAGVVSIPAGAWVIEGASALLSAKQPPQFTLEPYTGVGTSRIVFVLYPGMQGGPDQFDPLKDYFRSLGHIVNVVNGSNVWDTPAATVKALREFGLAKAQVFIVGLSLGAGKLVRCLRLVLDRVLNVLGVIIMSGAPTPRAVIWSRAVKHGTRFLHGGLISKAIWRHMNLGRIKSVYADFHSGKIGEEEASRLLLEVARCLEIPARNITTSASMLRRGPKMKANEFDVEALVLSRKDDPRILRDVEGWQRGFPKAMAVHIPVPGHADLGTCAHLYIEAIDPWIRPILARQAALAA